MIIAERLADAAIECRLGLEPTDDDRLAYEACLLRTRSQFLNWARRSWFSRLASFTWGESGTIFRAPTLRIFSRLTTVLKIRPSLLRLVPKFVPAFPPCETCTVSLESHQYEYVLVRF